MTISQRIFLLLENKHLSQKDLAEYAGLSPAAISSWKSKNTSPSSDKLVKISEFLGVSVYFLLTGSEYPPSSPPLLMESVSEYQPALTEQEVEMIRLYRQLSDFDKGKFIGLLEHAAIGWKITQ